jgi:hypothetical protein
MAYVAIDFGSRDVLQAAREPNCRDYLSLESVRHEKRKHPRQISTEPRCTTADTSWSCGGEDQPTDNTCTGSVRPSMQEDCSPPSKGQTWSLAAKDGRMYRYSEETQIPTFEPAHGILSRRATTAQLSVLKRAVTSPGNYCQIGYSCRFVQAPPLDRAEWRESSAGPEERSARVPCQRRCLAQCLARSRTSVATRRSQHEDVATIVLPSNDAGVRETFEHSIAHGEELNEREGQSVCCASRALGKRRRGF